MAGGGSGDEEENYWPGFVDALTTMTMVLVFIMMVMGLVIFSLSQNSSRVKLTQIAQALSIDPTAATIESLQASIISAITAKTTHDAPTPKAATPGTPLATSPVASVAVETAAVETAPVVSPKPGSASKDDPKLPELARSLAIDKGEPQPQLSAPEKVEIATLEPSKPDAITKKQPSSAAATLSKLTPKADTKPQSAGTEKAARTATQTATGEEKVQSNIVSEEAKTSDATLEGTETKFKIRYADQSFEIGEEIKTSLDAFLTRATSRNGTGILDVRSFANVNLGGVSEARRAAYYRGMVVRQQLVAAGIQPGRIRLKIEDALRSDDENSVQILAQ